MAKSIRSKENHATDMNFLTLIITIFISFALYQPALAGIYEIPQKTNINQKTETQILQDKLSNNDATINQLTENPIIKSYPPIKKNNHKEMVSKKTGNKRVNVPPDQIRKDIVNNSFINASKSISF